MIKYLALGFIIFLSCQNKGDNIITAERFNYNNYSISKLSHLDRTDTIRLAIQNLNDSTILLKFFPKNHLPITVINCVNNNDHYTLDTVDYYPYYLNLKKYCKPRLLAVGKHINKNEYYYFESKKDYKLGIDTFIVISFIKDYDGVDGCFRIYYCNKIGYLAPEFDT